VLRRAALLATTLTALVAAPAGAQVAPADLEPHLRAFADVAAANGGTRAAGLPGYDRSADYAAGQLQGLGWQVTRTPVRFPFYEERSPSVLADGQPDRDFVAVRYSAPVDATGRLRVLRTRSCSRRGFRPVRRGEVVVAPNAACSFERAAAVAGREGAAALLFDTGPGVNPLRGTTFGRRLPIALVAVRSAVLARIVERGGPVRVKVDAVIAERTADNVVAELPGARSVVMAGGHLDSVPEGPGLNDNASGAALLLAVAERLAASRPRATVRLAFWTAEEYGLLGSRRYVADLPRDERRRIAAYLNFDMVGSPRAVPELYDGSRRIERALRRGLPRARIVDQGASSDHAPFQRVGIPIGGVYTGSLERGPGRRGVRDRCYHRACDGLENVNRAVLARVASAAEQALRELGR
jgi:hypothetical protein